MAASPARTILPSLLDAVTVAAVALAAWIFFTGGVVLSVGAIELRAQGIANPVAAALVAAALRRLLERDEPDTLVRMYRRAGRLLAAIGLDRRTVTAFAVFRADALLLALFAVWTFDRALTFPVAVHGDGVGYYAYVRSPLMDGDFQFHNEYRDYDPKQQWLHKTTATGNVDNPFSVGPALIWAPAFAIAWLAGSLANAAGAEVPLTGYSGPFVYATAGVTWLLGVVGVAILYRLLLAFYGRRTALVAAFATVLASPLAYYVQFSPFYSHAVAFFATALLLLLCVRTTATARLWQWGLLGLAGALVALSRWQDAVFWIVPFIHLLRLAAAEARRAGVGAGLAYALSRGLAFLAGLGLGLIPQILAFHEVYGFWLGVPQGGKFVDRVPRYLWPTLFSWRHGLFSWTPLMLPATLGLAWAALKRRPWATAFFAALLLQLYSNGCLWQWWAGSSFGARRFSSSIPLFAFGLAALLSHVEAHRWLRYSAYALLAIAVTWNHLLLHQWVYGEIPHQVAIDPNAALATGWRYVSGFELRRIIGYDTLLSEIVYRLSDITHDRPLVVLGAALLYIVSRRRAARSAT